jgi:phage terminase large subunit-like protein
MPIHQFLKGTRLFMTVDTSYSAGPDSDSKVCCLMGVNWNNDLFVLDLWSGRCHQPDLIKATLQMAERWRCPSIHVEAIRQGITVYHDLYNIVATKAREMVEVNFLPRIHKFNPGLTEKTAKIASLSLRFEQSRIKLPLKFRGQHPWRALFNQIDEFNPEAPDGGLQHDDELDTVSMSNYIIKRRLDRPTSERPRTALTPLQRMKQGETHDAAGQPIAFGIDWSQVATEDVREILSLRTEQEATGGATKV